MSECRRTVEQLTPFVDGVLPAGERADVERHLGQCPPCRRAAVEVAGGRTVLRERAAHLKDAPLPPGLRTRCEALAREHASVKPTLSWYSRVAPALVIAALVIAATVLLFALATQRSNVLLAQQLTVDHMKCFRLLDSSGAVDAHAVEAMFEDLYDWDVHVPPSSIGDGVTLVSGRRCLYASGPIPHVMYRVNGQNMSLYMLEGVSRPPADVVTFGHHTLIWSQGSTTYVLVTPRDSIELTRAAKYVMQQAH